ncbi:MAG: protein jag [Clostridia bacterium]|nr:protein jag [Clostridia bacterium]
MAKEIVKEAASVEEAKALIAAEMNVPEEKIAFEVLQEGGKKVLGLFGGGNAIVKGVLVGSAADAAKAYLEQVLAAMGVEDFTCEVTETENGCNITLDGEDLGFIIGRRGDTLDALQYLSSLVANRVDNAYYRVTLDIGNYREKREQALVRLAHRLGGQVARTGRRRSLEPMNPYERRIIHTAVQEMDGITSWSVGSEPNRHVVIGSADDTENRDDVPPARGERRRSRGGRGSRGGNGGERRRERAPRREHEIVAPERPVREFISRSNPLPMADGGTVPTRTESAMEDSASLYGRIDL